MTAPYRIGVSRRFDALFAILFGAAAVLLLFVSSAIRSIHWWNSGNRHRCHRRGAPECNSDGNERRDRRKPHPENRQRRIVFDSQSAAGQLYGASASAGHADHPGEGFGRVGGNHHRAKFHPESGCYLDHHRNPGRRASSGKRLGLGRNGDQPKNGSGDTVERPSLRRSCLAHSRFSDAARQRIFDRPSTRARLVFVQLGRSARRQRQLYGQRHQPERSESKPDHVSADYRHGRRIQSRQFDIQRGIRPELGLDRKYRDSQRRKYLAWRSLRVPSQ